MPENENKPRSKWSEPAQVAMLIIISSLFVPLAVFLTRLALGL